MNEKLHIPGFDGEVGERIVAVWKEADDSLKALARAGRLDPAVDFMRKDLRGWPFAGQDVRGINFSGSDLRGTGIEKANWDETTILAGALLSDAQVEKMRFQIIAQGQDSNGSRHLALHAERHLEHELFALLYRAGLED